MRTARSASLLLVLGVAICAGAQNNPGLPERNCTFIGSRSHTCSPNEFIVAVTKTRKVAVVGESGVPTWFDIAARLDRHVSPDEYDALRKRYFDEFVKPRVGKENNLQATWEQFKRITNRPDSNTRIGPLERSINGDANDDGVRATAVTVLKGFRRFQIVADPSEADLVLNIRKYQPYSFDGVKNEAGKSVLLVWSAKANPRTDDVLWYEEFDAKWPQTDTVAQVTRQFLGQVTPNIKSRGPKERNSPLSPH